MPPVVWPPAEASAGGNYTATMTRRSSIPPAHWCSRSWGNLCSSKVMIRPHGHHRGSAVTIARNVHLASGSQIDSFLTPVAEGRFVAEELAVLTSGRHQNH